MKAFRRGVAIFLAFLATIMLVAALVVRVAYNTVFDTDTYVQTVAAIAENPESLSRVSDFISNSFTDSADLGNPKLDPLFRRAGIDQSKFELQVRSILQKSVYEFMQSQTFTTLWEGTNRAAHSQLMALINSDSTVKQDFMVDLGPIVKAAAMSIQDSNGYIAKIIPLKTFVPQETTMQFTLIQASGVEDLRTAVDIAGKARTGLLFGSLFILAMAWLLFGRTRGAHRMVAIAIASAGTITLVIKAIGKNVVHGVVDVSARDSADAIYSVTTSPLTGYAVFILMIGFAGFGATFYRRTAHQASGNRFA